MEADVGPVHAAAARRSTYRDHDPTARPRLTGRVEPPLSGRISDRETETMSVQEGDTAPDFEMPASGGRTVSLTAMKGKPFILYFYPKADTPGCTKEACAFQEALPQLGHIGLDVIGVSPDKMKPIEKFAEKYGLKFPLASDETKTVAERYGTWVEKSMYGRKYMGMERSTFLVGADGKVKKVWRKVSVTGHAADVLKAAEAL
jgi:peroxiredoxin Q/BCP